MKKKIKSILSVMLVMAMVVTMLPMNVNAEEASNVAQIGDEEYSSLQTAIDNAKEGDTIKIINNISVTEENTTSIEGIGMTCFGVKNKIITIDLNGKTISADFTGYAGDELQGVISVLNGKLTLKNSVGNGKVELTAKESNKVKALVMNAGSDKNTQLVIEGGNYSADDLPSGNGMIYSKGDENTAISGGNFHLEGIGTKENGSPWIINASSQNTKNIIVTGGTFNADINHQYYPFEVDMPKELALKYDGDEAGTWTVVDAVAYVTEQEWSSKWYTHEVGYATMEEAEAAAKSNKEAVLKSNKYGDTEAGRTAAAEKVEVHTLTPIASLNGKNYYSLQEAINAANDGDVITVLNNINLTETELQLLDNSYDTYFKVEGKTVTVDLNGKTISGEYAGDNMLVGVFSTDNSGHLILTGNGTVNLTATGKVYSLFANYESKCSITIENGTYTLDKASDSLAYTGGSDDLIVKGGTFTLGNIGSGKNGSPWIFNAKGQNTNHVIVTGGTFNAEINHQYYPFEVTIPEKFALRYDGDEAGTWTIVDAVAYVTEQEWSSKWYTHKIGYATMEEAEAAAESNKEAVLNSNKYGDTEEGRTTAAELVKVYPLVPTETVRLVIYRNGKTEEAYNTVSLQNEFKGNTIDLRELAIEDHYSSTNGFQFSGYFNDGGWNNYVAGKNPTPLTEIKVNGWTNIKCMVTDYEKVIVKAVYDGDKDNAETIYTGLALHGEDLVSYLEAKVTDLDKEGYELDKWFNWDWYGHKIAGDATVNGWTNVYVTYTDVQASTATFTYSNGNGANVTNQDVVVTMTTSEPIQTPEGWEKVSDTEFTKTHSENGKFTVEIADLAGNKATVKYEVKRIDRTNPVIEGIVDGAYYKEDVTYSITEQSLSHVVIDGVEYKDIKKIPYTITEEGTHTITAYDKAGNASDTVTFTIDKTAPVIELTYSNNGEPTNQDVVVTLTANEPIQKPGNKWTAVEGTNGTQWTAVYSENYEYRYFKGTDLAGNKSESVWFKVEGIDKVVPEAVVTYETQEDGSVVVFITADEAVTVSGEEWEATDVENQFKKTFTENGEETVTLTDAAGNTTEVTVTIDSIVEDPCAKCHAKVCIIKAVPATCTTKGYTGDKFCKECDEIICKGKEIPALGHHYVERDCSAKEPTCTESGKKADKVCILCGDVIPGKEIPATGHSYVVDETTKVEPTCTEPGKEADKVCENCGDVIPGKEIPATGHSYVVDETTKVEPTCTEPGKEADKVCENCGDVIPGKEIPALGHSDDCGHDDGNDDITGGNGDDGNGDDGDDNVTGGNGDDEKNDDVTGVDDDDNRDGNRGKNDDKSDEDGSPKTGDSANIMGCIYAMAMAVAAVIAVIKKRRA